MTAANRSHWRERAQLHPGTPMYQGMFERLERGGHCLLPTEVEELGSVAGKKVLHLQCHLGQDSLSLVRLGADVTAIDFADEAVAFARQKSAELGLPARFLLGDVLQADRHPELVREAATFDLVFASYGVLGWIGDLRRWMQVAAHFVAPGGGLYIIEGHPFADVFADELGPDGKLVVRYPYFADGPLQFEESGSYAQRDAATEHNRTDQWAHRLGELVTEAAKAGLRIRRLNEHRDGFWPRYPGQTVDERGVYPLPPELDGLVPMSYSLWATKD